MRQKSRVVCRVEQGHWPGGKEETQRDVRSKDWEWERRRRRRRRVRRIGSMVRMGERGSVKVRC